MIIIDDNFKHLKCARDRHSHSVVIEELESKQKSRKKKATEKEMRYNAKKN